MKVCSSVLSWIWKYFNGNHRGVELFCHFIDRFIREVIRESFVGGKVEAFNQDFKPSIADLKSSYQEKTKFIFFFGRI